MFRAPNPFDTRVGHAAQHLASGGSACSTCTSCCSCVVSAIAVSALSARMVAKAHPPAKAEAAPDETSVQAPATPPQLRGLRILVGALLPLATLLGLGLFGFNALTASHSLGALGLLSLFPLGIAWAFAIRGKTRLGLKLALLILIGLPVLLLIEMFLWINGARH